MARDDLDGRELTPEQGNEELWAHVFGVGAADLLDQRTFHSRLPSPPRCRLCKAPFKGIGGFILGFRGKRPAKRNPYFCNACDKFLEAHPGGAEVPMSLIYADIRKSTEFVRDHSPAEVSKRINKFLDFATAAITESDGFLLAFYGDCVVANWPPGFSGEDHAEKALQSARALSKASVETGIPVGVGIHMGDAYMCSVEAAQGTFRDVSVFGEAVNLVARLSDEAEAGAILASEPIADAVGVSGEKLSLNLKGFDQPVPAWKVS